MHVVRHQAPRPHLQAMLDAGRRHQVQVGRVILRAEERRPPPISAVYPPVSMAGWATWCGTPSTTTRARRAITARYPGDLLRSSQLSSRSPEFYVTGILNLLQSSQLSSMSREFLCHRKSTGNPHRKSPGKRPQVFRNPWLTPWRLQDAVVMNGAVANRVIGCVQERRHRIDGWKQSAFQPLSP